MNGEWIWILLALFGIFRLLMLAGKKKAGQEAPPSSPGPGRQSGPAPPPREEVDELKAFIDSLAGRVGAEPRSRPPDPPRGWQSAFQPPAPPRPRPRTVARPRPRPPEASPTPPPPAPSRPSARIPGPRPAPGFLNFSSHPVVQGIIFSEILGPPRGLGGGSTLPGDF
jgi:hypothetical protein